MKSSEGQERYTLLKLDIKALQAKFQHFQSCQFTDCFEHLSALFTAAKDAKIEEEIHSPTENNVVVDDNFTLVDFFLVTSYRWYVNCCLPLIRIFSIVQEAMKNYPKIDQIRLVKF